ncbi:glycosyltransferase family 2 protein [Clostridia bacterium]|nr:glycosyltransferase family 2 protein [Clostridia bacterium]
MVSVVIPVLNGEKSVKKVVAGLIRMQQKEALDLEIILVDDASQDASEEIIFALANEHPVVRAFKNDTRKGQQDTLLKGLALAHGDVLVTMDDDCQHNPEDIPRLLNIVASGYDLVYGISGQKEAGFIRSIGSKMRDAMFRHLYPSIGENKVGSFRAFTRRLHLAARRHDGNFNYISCMHLELEPQVASITTTPGSSARDKSNYNLLSLVHLLLRIYWYYGLRRPSNTRRKGI